MSGKILAQRYDRPFLLSAGKRNQVMELWEVQKFGVDSYGDAEYVCIYGMSPTEWYRRGVRLLARTTVEAIRDRLGDLIGHDVERVVHDAASSATFRVIDPFAGSCNALYWILRHLPGSNGVGFEIDETIFDMTRRNLPSLDRRIELIRGDYRALLDRHRAPSEHCIVVFLAPPWGDALTDNGLDLRRTTPPVAEIVEDFERI